MLLIIKHVVESNSQTTRATRFSNVVLIGRIGSSYHLRSNKVSTQAGGKHRSNGWGFCLSAASRWEVGFLPCGWTSFGIRLFSGGLLRRGIWICCFECFYAKRRVIRAQPFQTDWLHICDESCTLFGSWMIFCYLAAAEHIRHLRCSCEVWSVTADCL